ncbi:hypothetical protein OSI88_06430 [Mycobacterium ulcerans]
MHHPRGCRRWCGGDPSRLSRQLTAHPTELAPIHDLPLDDLGIPGVSVDIDAKVPNLNSVEQVVPNVSVPNINLPNVKVNPGHVGLPGRGR